MPPDPGVAKCSQLNACPLTASSRLVWSTGAMIARPVGGREADVQQLRIGDLVAGGRIAGGQDLDARVDEQIAIARRGE